MYFAWLTSCLLGKEISQPMLKSGEYGGCETIVIFFVARNLHTDKQSKQVWYMNLVAMWCIFRFFLQNALNGPNEIPTTLATSQIVSADNLYSSTPQNSSHPTNDKLAAWGHAGRHLLPHPGRWSSCDI